MNECITAYLPDDKADLLTAPAALTEAEWWAAWYGLDDEDIAWEEYGV